MIRLSEIAQAVLDLILLQSVYALVLFPVVWGMVKCCRGKYPRWQHGLWLLIFLRLVLPPDMANPWSAGHLIRSLTPYTFSRSLLSFPYAPLIDQDHEQPLAVSLSNESNPDDQNSSGVVPSVVPEQITVHSPTPLKWFGLIVSCVYITIVTLLLIQFLRIRFRFWKIAGQGKRVQDSVVLDIVRTWRKRLHISRHLEIKTVVSDSPTYTMGLFRPVVILPEHLIRSDSRAALEPILAHELVHVKRWDDLAICLQELVRIIYFFHPLVWFVMPRLTWTREAVCDATVLSHNTLSPRTYGRQMLASVQTRAVPTLSPEGLAKFTSVARGIAFRLNLIQKEDNMKSHPFIIYLAVLILGIFLLPMAPVVSSDQANPTLANDTLTQYIKQCVPCQNPEEVSHIIWGDLVTEGFQQEDFSRLVSATDCDIIENIGDGQKSYVFYLLSDSRLGVYRPNFHFLMNQNKLMVHFKSRNPSTYVTNRPKVNGRYEIEEGWRADILNGITDDRVNLAWGSSVWFWDGTQYLKAYTEYTIEEATDPSLLGTKREWEKGVRSLYEAAPRT